jgi:hypothetical protein
MIRNRNHNYFLNFIIFNIKTISEESKTEILLTFFKFILNFKNLQL